jgi:hypothetical protein
MEPSLATKINNYLKKVHNMKYRMIITYNFSEDETRSTFEELVDALGFVEAEDQSTYVLPYVINKVSKDVVDPIVKWSEGTDNQISADDFVQLFYLAYDAADEKKVNKIASKYLKYNPKTKGLI